MRDVGKILPVILSGNPSCGGDETASVQLKTRRFGQSLLQNTAARYDSDLFHNPVFIAPENQLGTIQSQISDLGIEIGAMIIEPEGRGTTACAITAALYASTFETKPLVLLSPSDQYVAYPQAFRRSIAATIPVVSDGYIATFGMEADYPETDYAYLRKGESLRPGTFLVDHFIEKPNKETAQELLASGDYYWNAGIYLFDDDNLLDAARSLMPDLVGQCEVGLHSAAHEDNVTRLNAEAFLKCEPSSFDKTIMEHIENKALIPARIGWSDRGEKFPSVDSKLRAVDFAS